MLIFVLEGTVVASTPVKLIISVLKLFLLNLELIVFVLSMSLAFAFVDGAGFLHHVLHGPDSRRALKKIQQLLKCRPN